MSLTGLGIYIVRRKIKGETKISRFSSGLLDQPLAY